MSNKHKTKQKNLHDINPQNNINNEDPLNNNDNSGQIIEQLKDQMKQEKEKLLLIIADYDNKIKRMQIDNINTISKSIENIITELTPFIDDLNSAKNIAPQEIQEGLDLIIRNFKKTLKKNGIIEIIPKENDKFNLEIHQAISSNCDDFEKAKIKKIFKNGYKFGDKVIIPAMVMVE